MIMKREYTLFLVIAVASVVRMSQAASVGIPHKLGGEPWKHKTRPAVFVLHLYRNHHFIRACRGAELNLATKIMWITAAQCLDKKKYTRLEVQFPIMGKYEYFKFNLSEVSYYIHPQYEQFAREQHNIALIRPLVQFNVNKDPSLRRIQLPKFGENFIGRVAHLFYEPETNSSSDDTDESYEVQSLRAKILDPDLWKKRYPIYPISYSSVCTFGLSCSGLNWYDIGMAMIVREDDDTFKYVAMAADTSAYYFTYNLQMKFTKIDPYIDWIQTPTEHYAV